MFKPKGFYAEMLDSTRRELLGQPDKEERKILRKILGLRYVDGKQKLTSSTTKINHTKKRKELWNRCRRDQSSYVDISSG